MRKQEDMFILHNNLVSKRKIPIDAMYDLLMKHWRSEYVNNNAKTYSCTTAEDENVYLYFFTRDQKNNDAHRCDGYR